MVACDMRQFVRKCIVYDQVRLSRRSLLGPSRVALGLRTEGSGSNRRMGPMALIILVRHV